MKLKYQARTKDGLVQIGIIEAPSKNRAVALLQEKGLYVTYLEEESQKPFYAREISIFRGIKKKEIVLFTRQLSLMLKSGVSLVESLRAVALQADNDKFRRIILDVAEDVEGGTYFSEALAKFPRVFSTLFVNMVKSGEASGKLSESLTYLAEHLESEYALIGKIKSSLTYPVFIMFLLLCIVLLMIFFIFPTFLESLQSLNVELPWFTRVVISVASFLRKWWWLILTLLLSSAGILVYYFKTKEGKEVLAKILLRMPVFGKLIKKIYLSRLTENLASLIKAGLPITQALEIAGGVIGNKKYEDIIFDAKEAVRKGESISSVFERYPQSIPNMVVQLVKVGEKTGRLDEALVKVADFYQGEIDRTVSSLTRLIEPILLLFAGGLVVILMLSVFIPIYNTIGNLTI